MPSLLRLEIERLFKLGKIRFLVCTSTLIEGVNLSCRTIVLRGPRKGKNTPMKPHDFWNLAGRAGRWGNEFQGSIVCIDPHDKSAWPHGVPTRSRYHIRRETDAMLASGETLIGFLRDRKGRTPADLAPDSHLEQVGAYLLSTYLREGTIVAAPFAKRHDPTTIRQVNEALASLAAGLAITPELAARHPGVSAVGMQSLLEYFQAYEGPVEQLLPPRAEDDEAIDSLIFIMTTINERLFPAFMPATLIPLHAITVRDWLRGWSLSRMIRSRIDYNRRHGRTVDVPKICRHTMEVVEQTARFLAPKYLSAYFDVLKVYLSEKGRENLFSEELDVGIALEFGISTQTLPSLMELGLSRMSAVTLYERMAVDDLDQDGCREWVRQNDAALDGTDIPVIILREIREKLLGTKVSIDIS